MIDFTTCPVNRFKAYGGANGNKIHILYQGRGYMLKFPPAPGRKAAISYTNGCISEYLACHIYESLGFKTQKTLLGTYTDSRGKEKIVVACEDFTQDGKTLMEFAHLKNTCIDSEQSGYGTELSSILTAIDEQTLVPSDELRQFFWDMFIADALLGNFDRHNGNWGVLVDEQEQSAQIAPIYDCGSCLYPQLAVDKMKQVLESQEEIDRRIHVFPASAIMEDGKKIAYAEYISSLKDEGCTAALERVHARIDMERIHEIIWETPGLEPIQCEFYEVMLRERKEAILDSSMEKLLALREQHSGSTISL